MNLEVINLTFLLVNEGIGVWFSMVEVRRDILPSLSLHPIMKDNKSQP
jgi:hypothetical protein